MDIETLYQEKYEVTMHDLNQIFVPLMDLKPSVPLLLRGPLGVGKSTLARRILEKMCPEQAPFQSPSFPLMLPYDLGGQTLWHMDLYRLNHANELLALNLPDLIHGALCLIEWPEILMPFLEKGLEVRMDFGLTPSTRHIILQSWSSIIAESNF